MLLEPPIDALIKEVGNPYKLAVIVSKRAKLLQQTLSEKDKEDCPEVTRAVNEVFNGEIIGN